jgi:hypothetical protein
MKEIFTIIMTIGLTLTSVAQDNPDYLLWNSSHKLAIDDFAIKKDNSNSGLSFAQFYIEHSVSGLDFMTKKFNKKVKNCMIKSASWIDTAQNVEYSLKYQQTLFDIAEIYARKFRKELQENRKQLSKGLSIVNDLNSKITAEFSKRRLQYDSETNSGLDSQKQIVWDKQIAQELQDLADYDYNK